MNGGLRVETVRHHSLTYLAELMAFDDLRAKEEQGFPSFGEMINALGETRR